MGIFTATESRGGQRANGQQRVKYWDEMKQPGPAIYHCQAVLDQLKGNRVPDRAARFGGMHVSFGGENRGMQAV
jgi:hypothetical protein